MGLQSPHGKEEGNPKGGKGKEGGGKVIHRKVEEEEKEEGIWGFFGSFDRWGGMWTVLDGWSWWWYMNSVFLALLLSLSPDRRIDRPTEYLQFLLLHRRRHNHYRFFCQ